MSVVWLNHPSLFVYQKFVEIYLSLVSHMLLVVNLFLFYLHFNCMLGPKKRSENALPIYPGRPSSNTKQWIPEVQWFGPLCLCIFTAYQVQERIVFKSMWWKKEKKRYPRQNVVFKCCCFSTVQFFQKTRLCWVKQMSQGNVPPFQIFPMKISELTVIIMRKW